MAIRKHTFGASFSGSTGLGKIKTQAFYIEQIQKPGWITDMAGLKLRKSNTNGKLNGKLTKTIPLLENVKN